MSRISGKLLAVISRISGYSLPGEPAVIAMRSDEIRVADGRKAGDRQLVWIAALPTFYTPEAPPGWRLTDLAGNSEINSGKLLPGSGYSVVFEATFNSRLDYDPAVQARAARQFFRRAPDTLVAVVAPSLEVPAETQHAIAGEIGLVLGAARTHVVTVTEHWSTDSVGKMRKTRPREWTDRDLRYRTGVDDALDIVAGKGNGGEVDPIAARFVYAFTERTARQPPFRCNPTQRRILQVVASGSIVPTTSAIALAVHTTEKKVNENIAVLVENLAPRAAGEPESRDSFHRLYWLMHRYGAWIRLVEGRANLGGSTP